MQRIYLPNTSFSELLSISEKELYHQITRVLRARVGQQYVFFDGKILQDYVYEISEIDAKKVVFLQKEVIVKNIEIFPKLHLYQALPNKLEKLEYIIQKSCEVGYSHISFFLSERSQILQLSENKKERLHKIAIEAIEQCGGNMIPEIEFLPQNLTLTLSSKEREQAANNTMKSHLLLEEKNCDEVLWAGKTEISLFCHTSSTNTKKLSQLSFQDITRVNIYVGPEGGFSQSETDLFYSQGMQGIYLGARILRTETVAPLIGFYMTQKKQG